MGDDRVALDYIISGILGILLVYAGYCNGKKNMTYRSVLWIFFVNAFLFLCSGIFDRFGGSFNILSAGSGNSFIFTALFIAYNGYLYPLIIALDDTGLDFILPLTLSFMLPVIGYCFARLWKKSKEDKSKETGSDSSF